MENTFSFPYTIKKNPRAKSLRIAVTSKGVRVSVPHRVSEKKTLEFIKVSESWIKQQLQKIELQKSSILDFPENHSYDKYKARAKKRIVERVREINKHYKFIYNKITIKNTSTRWGSCSSQGNLNFAYQLYFLPENLVDYVVAHELSHLKEMNHSVRFWRLVAEVVPDYQKRRHELKKYHIG